VKPSRRVLALIGVAVLVGLLLAGMGYAADLMTKSGPNVPFQAIYVDEGTVYGGTYLGAGVYRSTSNGTAWAEWGQGLPSGVYMPDVVAMAKRGDDVLAGTWGEGVYKRAPGDSNWSLFSEGLVEGYNWIRAMAVGPGATPYIYAADPDRVVYRLAWGSSTWTEISSGFPSQSDWDIVCLFVDDGGTAYAGLKTAGVYEYTGTAWQAKGSLGRSAMAIDYGPDGALWVATDNGVYRWSSGAWEQVSGTSGWDATAMKRNPQHTDELFVGLRTGQVYRYRASTGAWDAVNMGISGTPRVWSLACGTGEPQRIMAGTADGFYYADTVHETATPTNTNTPVPTNTPTPVPTLALILSLSNDPGTSVSLGQGDVITYSIGYSNTGPSALSDVVVMCRVPVSGVVGWNLYTREETGESIHVWDVGTVPSGGTGQDNFWVAVGPPPTIPAPPGAMLVVNEGAYGLVGTTPVPTSEPVYNWIGSPARIYLPMVMKSQP